MTEREAKDADERFSPRRALARFIFGFLCVFAGLALPSPGLGPTYARVHAALGNALFEGRAFASGARLRFEANAEELAENPWQTMLVVAPPGNMAPARVAIDLRTLGYLPTAAYVALVAAVPVRSARRSVRVLLLGLAILVPLLLLLVALPLVSFLGGQGPVPVYSLEAGAHVFVNVVYRALVAPPGMAYALPLLLFWALSRLSLETVSFRGLFTKFQSKRPRDVTTIPLRPS